MQLRDYQERAIASVREHYRRGRKRVLLVTGHGRRKTATAAELMRAAVARGLRCVFAVHLREVVLDTAERLRREEIACGVVMGEEDACSDAPVQVVSIATHASSCVSAGGSRHHRRSASSGSGELSCAAAAIPERVAPRTHGHADARGRRRGSRTHSTRSSSVQPWRNCSGTAYSSGSMRSCLRLQARDSRRQRSLRITNTRARALL